MLNIQQLNNKKLALALWYKDENGEDQVTVYAGVFCLHEGVPFLDRGKDAKKLEIKSDWLERIKEVENDEMRKIFLGADYSLSLSVGNMSEEQENNSEGSKTGFKLF